MSAEKVIKSQARKTLSHNYITAIVALLAVLLPFYIIDGATTAVSCGWISIIPDEDTAALISYLTCYPLMLAAGFLLSPIINGYIRTYYKAGYTEKMDPRDIFYYFHQGSYSAALRLNLSFVLRMLPPVILFYLPLLLYSVNANSIGKDFYDSVLYHDLYFILAVIATLLTVLYSLRYFTVFTISIENEQLSPAQAFNYSRYIMKGKTGNAAKLIFSFTPWLLLCMLVLPALYVIPYMTQSLCISAKWMTRATFEVN